MSQIRQRALALSILSLALPALAEKTDKRAPAAKAPAGAPAGAEPVALVDGVAITMADVDKRAAGELATLRQQEYDLRERTIDALVTDALVNKAAAAKGLSSSEYLRTEIDSKVTPVTEDEKKATYEKYKNRLQGVAEPDAMRQVEEFLRRQRTDERRQALLVELRSAAKVRLLIEPPRRAVEASGPAKGPADAPVTIVEFSDFQCPFCARVNDTLRQVVERYPTQVRIVFRDFPLPMHANAPKAAEAAGCADEQGKFWPMHDRLFSNQNALDPDALKKSAADLGLDATRFGECLDSGKLASEVAKDVEAGKAQGVQGTPAFFINGRFLSGALPLEQFSKLIDDELMRKGLPVPPPKTAAAAVTSSN